MRPLETIKTILKSERWMVTIIYFQISGPVIKPPHSAKLVLFLAFYRKLMKPGTNKTHL